MQEEANELLKGYKVVLKSAFKMLATVVVMIKVLLANTPSKEKGLRQPYYGQATGLRNAFER